MIELKNKENEKTQNAVADEIYVEPIILEESKNEQGQLISAEDIKEYIEHNPDKIEEAIKGMTKEQKLIIMRAIICSSPANELGDIFKDLFGNTGVGGNRNGGVDHE